MYSLPAISAVCLALTRAVASAHYPPANLPNWNVRNLKTIETIYHLTVYPNNVPIVNNGASAVPAGLFNVNATGRISPLGNFTGFDDSTEYFFGLAPIPSKSAGVGIFKADVVSYTSGCPGVAASVVYLHTTKFTENGTIDATVKPTILSQVAFWRFDSSGAVLQYNAWLPELAMWTKLAIGVDTSNSFVQTAVRSTLCTQIQENCSGPNLQYNSTAGCNAIMATKEFGSYDEVWGDNVVCRNIHVMLTHVRPEVHCPHVGPRGGSPPNNFKCVAPDYTVDYFDDTRLYGSPETFNCDADAWAVDNSTSCPL
ncbi:hypothetical protein WAI453_008004 [Rhynchosporium graminicola]